MLVLTSCATSSSSDSDPRQTLDRYLVAWDHGDWAAMRPLLAGAPRTFMRDDAQVAFGNRGDPLALLDRAHQSDRPRFDARACRGPAAPARAGHVAYDDVRLIGQARRSLARRLGAVDHRPPPHQRADVWRWSHSWPARGEILGARGIPLTTDDPRVTVGVVGERIRDPATVLADLVEAGAPRSRARSALAAARAQPDQFEPVFEISRARFEQLRAAPGPDNVYAVSGTSFQATGARRAITEQLATHIVGSVGSDHRRTAAPAGLAVRRLEHRRPDRPGVDLRAPPGREPEDRDRGS